MLKTKQNTYTQNTHKHNNSRRTKRTNEVTHRHRNRTKCRRKKALVQKCQDHEKQYLKTEEKKRRTTEYWRRHFAVGKWRDNRNTVTGWRNDIIQQTWRHLAEEQRHLATPWRHWMVRVVALVNRSVTSLAGLVTSDAVLNPGKER